MQKHIPLVLRGHIIIHLYIKVKALFVVYIYDI